MNNDVVSIPPNYPTSTTTPRPTHPHQTAKGHYYYYYYEDGNKRSSHKGAKSKSEKKARK